MKARWLALLILLGGTVMWARGGSKIESWMSKVPAAQREQVNPYANRPEAAAAGRMLFTEHCAQCHGADALGRRGPSLRSTRLGHATDGELGWILKNGYTRKGMPSWSRLPEPERWQIIAYLRSLPAGDAALDASQADAAASKRNLQ